MQSVYYFRHVGGKCQGLSFLDIFIDIFILVFSNYKKFYLLQAFCKHKAQKPLIYKASGLYYTIQTPYRLSYFLCLSRFLLLKTTSFRLFLFIIFSFQNFRYHSDITNGYQCSYWYYDSDEVNLQVVNPKYSSPQLTNILYIIQLPFILLIFFIQFPKKISRSLSHITK